MIIDIPDEKLAKVALGLNGSTPEFCFEAGQGYPLLVSLRMVSLGEHRGKALQFSARRGGEFLDEVTLSYGDIFHTQERLKKVLDLLSTAQGVSL